MKPLSHENFLQHLSKSLTATKLGVKNDIPSELIQNANVLFTFYRFITDKLGFPNIYITSGYRCPELNKVVVGVPGSKHSRCKAFDFTFNDVVTKSDFLNSFNLLCENYINYRITVNGMCASTALEEFDNHFILYPERLYIHFQID